MRQDPGSTPSFQGLHGPSPQCPPSLKLALCTHEACAQCWGFLSLTTPTATSRQGIT